MMGRNNQRDGSVAGVLDFRIQTFLRVCRNMSFTAASEELHITQPAVSQHIRYLEKAYGCPLFIRDGKRVSLTPAGEVLLHTMGSLQNDHLALVRRMQEAGGTKKTLTFGVTLTIGEYAILPALAQYLKEHLDINVQVRYGNTHTLVDLLHEGKIDFALVEGYVPMDDFDTLVDRMEPYLPVCAKGHVFQKPVSTLKDLLGERLLIREEGSGTREILEKYLSALNLSLADFTHYAQVENMHSIVGLLLRDCGITFLYQAAVQDLLQQGLVEIIPISDFQMHHEFTFIWNKNSCFAGEYRDICHQLHTADARSLDEPPLP